ncbi:ATP synthase subunit s, mitochondrial-like [Uranotaenia lowii]|uniref:ATP synthase subunit s, mitochondrial-like n=1 Tax=Uranotaenia lowii TaxID=190385 RepID=UPI002479F047|nr:ATP synthase subunit s, mitochondrial-like [Uranotaenia lowii]
MFARHALQRFSRPRVANLIRGPGSDGGSSRQLWAWINMMFNRVDQDRLKQFGPDRACAEWLLRNGARVKFCNQKQLHVNYNFLPDESVPLAVEEIDGTDSGISSLGFDHLKNLKRLRKIKLHNCVYVENEALDKLKFVVDTLEELEVSSCKNITDQGLLCIKDLKNLKLLSASNLPYVKDMKVVEQELKKYIPNCSIDLQV